MYRQMFQRQTLADVLRNLARLEGLSVFTPWGYSLYRALSKESKIELRDHVESDQL